MKKYLLPSRSSLSSTVIRLGLVSFFADLSSEMLYPITPIFLTATLGASMASVGLVEGFAEGLASLLKVSSGFWSDRIQKRRMFVSVGYLLSGLAKPLIGFSSSWLHVFFARGMDRTGKGIRTAPRDALISESIDPESQGEAFGWHRLMDTLGAAFGPLLAILFLSLNSESFRSLYFWAFIPGMIAFGITFLVREEKRELPPKKAEAAPSIGEVTRDPEFRKYLMAWGVFSLVNSSDVFLLLRAKQVGMSLTITILLYCFYNLVYALTSPYLGRLSDRVDRKNILMGGLLIFSFVYYGFSQAAHAWQYWVLFGVYGLYMGATDGVGKALIADLVPRDLKATGMGLFGAVTGLTTIVASLVGGLLWDRFGPQATFLYGATGAVFSIFLLTRLEGRYKP